MGSLEDDIKECLSVCQRRDEITAILLEEDIRMSRSEAERLSGEKLAGLVQDFTKQPKRNRTN